MFIDDFEKEQLQQRKNEAGKLQETQQVKQNATLMLIATSKCKH